MRLLGSFKLFILFYFLRKHFARTKKAPKEPKALKATKAQIRNQANTQTNSKGMEVSPHQ